MALNTDQSTSRFGSLAQDSLRVCVAGKENKRERSRVRATGSCNQARWKQLARTSRWSGRRGWWQQNRRCCCRQKGGPSSAALQETARSSSWTATRGRYHHGAGPNKVSRCSIWLPKCPFINLGHHVLDLCNVTSPKLWSHKRGAVAFYLLIWLACRLYFCWVDRRKAVWGQCRSKVRKEGLQLFRRDQWDPSFPPSTTQVTYDMHSTLAGVCGRAKVAQCRITRRLVCLSRPCDAPDFIGASSEKCKQ